VRQLIATVRLLSFYLNVLGGICLVSMMVSVLADISTRTLFGLTDGAVDLTFTGSFELVRYGLLFAMVFSMPYCLDRGQVVVELFTEGFSVTAKARIAAFFTLFFGIFGGLMCYRLLHSAGAARLTGETTQDLLVPMSSIYTVAALGMAMLALRGLSLAYSLWYQRDGDVV